MKIYYFNAIFKTSPYIMISHRENQKSFVSLQPYVKKTGVYKINLSKKNIEGEIVFYFTDATQSAKDFPSERAEAQYIIEHSQQKLFKIQTFGEYFFINGQIFQLKKRSPKPISDIVISTDLGGTLCGDIEKTQRFNNIWIQSFFYQKNCYLIYNTGRGLASYHKCQQANSLITPDFLIAKCGTVLYKNQSNTLVESEEWRQVIEKHWNPAQIINDLSNISYIVFKRNTQAQPNETNYHIVYQMNKHNFNINQQELYSKIQIMRQSGLQFNSFFREKGTNIINLEFIPINANKGKALEFICQNIIQCDLLKVVAFGDSMNDIDMIKMCGQGILVGNCQEDARDWVLQNKHLYNNTILSEHHMADCLSEYLTKIVN